jgi:Ca-activated chloride channel family protein
MTDPVLTLRVAPSFASMSPGRRKAFVSLALQAHGAPVEGERPPLHVSFALDLSGSMAGPPIEHVSRAVTRLVELLRGADRVGIVGFSDQATEIVAPCPLDDAARRTIRRRAQHLSVDGRTNVEAGLACARAQLEGGGEPLDPTARHAILLLSDGRPNVGASSPQELGALAAAMRPQISVHTLGFGQHHDEGLLAAVADAGGGQYRYIPDPVGCQAELAQVVGAQGDVVAEDIELVLVPADGVEIRRVLGASSTRVTAEGMVVSVPDQIDGAEVALAVEIKARFTADRMRGELLSARLRYRRAGTTDRFADEARATVDLAAGPPRLDPVAHARVLLVRADEARREARALADRGQFSGAAAVLRSLVAEIEAAPNYSPADGSPLSEAREALADEIQTFERVPSPEQYATFKKHALASSLAGVGWCASATALRGRHSLEFCERTAGPNGKAWLVVVTGAEVGRCHELGIRSVLGRTRTADVMLLDPGISRRHAEIVALDGHYWLRDLGATNPLLVNGSSVGQHPHRLSPGDRIVLGGTEVEFTQR